MINSTVNNKEYQTRAILFIDLLGFKNNVEQSISNQEIFNKILKAVNSLYKVKNDNDNGPLKGNEIGVEISAFSDSLVISKAINEPGSFYYLLNLAYFAVNEIIASGFVVRGAITVGKLYHDGKVIFGPAMNEAYCLEEKCAIYPRVIIQERIFDNMLLNNRLNDYDEERKAYEYLIRKDIDGLLFIDFLSIHHQYDDDENYWWILSKVKQLIVEGLKNSKSENITQKYNWLKHYFNSTLDLLPNNDERIPTKIG